MAYWKRKLASSCRKLASKPSSDRRNYARTIRNNETVLAIRPARNKITVITTDGEYEVKKLILSAGAWTNQLLLAYQLPLTVERQVLYRFNANNDTGNNFLPDNVRVYIW